jgi:hypothetical protein
MLQFFESGEGLPSEPLSPEQNAVLRTLFYAVHVRLNLTFIKIGNLTNYVNMLLAEMHENLRLQPRRVGAVLTSLGFSNRTRTNLGWTISVSRQDAEKLHQLAACYGVDGFTDRLLSISPNDCSLCQAAGLSGKRADPEIPGATTEEIDFWRELGSQNGSRS